MQDNKRKLNDEELEQVAGGGEGDDPKGGYKYICTTCGGEFCFEFIVVNCPSCGNSTLQEVVRKRNLDHGGLDVFNNNLKERGDIHHPATSHQCW